MADSTEVMKSITKFPGVSFPVLVPNLKVNQINTILQQTKRFFLFLQ
jgi:hypothetical protein